MTKALIVKAPRTTAQAVDLLERFASLQSQKLLAETSRNDAIANLNATADAVIAPIATELDAIAPVIQAWWASAGSKLLPADRKTMTLGGCDIGTVLGSKSLAYQHGDDKAAVKALAAQSWKKPFLRLTTALDKVAIRKALDAGPRAAQLAELGFTVTQSETFVLQRAEQAGTIGA